jgi:hypothetical protein
MRNHCGKSSPGASRMTATVHEGYHQNYHLCGRQEGSDSPEEFFSEIFGMQLVAGRRGWDRGDSLRPPWSARSTACATSRLWNAELATMPRSSASITGRRPRRWQRALLRREGAVLFSSSQPAWPELAAKLAASKRKKWISGGNRRSSSTFGGGASEAKGFSGKALGKYTPLDSNQ